MNKVYEYVHGCVMIHIFMISNFNAGHIFMRECTEYHHRIRCLFVFSCYVIINILAFLSDDSRYCIFVLLKRVVGDVFKRNFEESITIFALYS